MASTVTELLRRRFGGKKGDDYIKDGLIFHLDGIDRGTTDPTKWVDLVGGVEFSGTNNWGTNYRVCSSTDYMNATGFTEPTVGSCTMEIVFRMTALANRKLYEPNVRVGNNFVFGREYNYIVMFNNSGNKKCFSTNDVAMSIDHCVSYYNGLFVVDGAEMQTVNYDYYFGRTDGITQIGYESGRLYSIRFYNRLLTKDEMIHNQQVDNQRFNLGLNI